MGENVAAVTGAWSYSGRHVARHLLANGWALGSISNRSPSPKDDPYNELVRRIGYTHDVDRLAMELSGCRVLVSNFWTRHDKPPVGHRGPWLSHLQAVDQSAVLIEAAARAAFERLIWTSITNPGQDPDLSYFAGKAVVEQLVRGSGLSYAILRPACFFGGGGIRAAGQAVRPAASRGASRSASRNLARALAASRSAATRVGAVTAVGGRRACGRRAAFA